MLFRAYEGRERVKAMGWMSVIFAGAPVLGLAIGGVLVENIGWRPIFLIQGGLSALACGVAFLVLVETPRGEQVRLDIPGAVVLALAAFSLTFASTSRAWGPQRLITPQPDVTSFRVTRPISSPLSSTQKWRCPF